MQRDLCAELGLSVPILQAPMAGAAGPDLAAAVTNAGGLGGLAVGAMTAAQADTAIAATRALTSGPFNVNVFCHPPAVQDEAVIDAWLETLEPFFTEFGFFGPKALYEIYQSFVVDRDMQDLLIRTQPKVVSFHFGLPDPSVITALRDAGITLLATATNADEAELIAAVGVDAIVVQGVEAGGHRGMFDPDAVDDLKPTLDLLKQLRPRTNLPLIAAGGIMTGQDIATHLSAGADLVQLGTAFLGCSESTIDMMYRGALRNGKSTCLTSVVSGRPARRIESRFTDWGKAILPAQIPDYPLTYDAGKALHSAAKARSNHDFAAHWAGAGFAALREMPAVELMATLRQEMEIASN